MMLNSILVSLLLTSTALASSHRQQRQERASHEAIGSKISSRAARPPSGKVIESCTVPGTFALTFNDGVAPGSKIRTILQANGVKGSFFAAGSNYGSCIYDQADELIARYKAGHLMGITMWDFSDITTLSVVQLTAELDFMEAAFSKILGVRPAFFRPPYGNYDAVSLALITKRGYNVVTWSFDGGDDNGMADLEVIAAYQAIPPYPQTQTSISVSGEYTGEGFLDIVVKNLLKKGYKLVTVATCLGISPYQVTGGTPGKRDNSWNCDRSPLQHVALSSAAVNAASTSKQAPTLSSSSPSGSSTSASSSKAAASSIPYIATSSSSIAPKATSPTSPFSTETKSTTTAISSKPSQSSVVIALAPSSSSGSAYTSVTTSRSSFTSATPSTPSSIPITSASASTTVTQTNKSTISSTIATTASSSSTSVGTTSLSYRSSMAVSSISTSSPTITTSTTLVSSSSVSASESKLDVSSTKAPLSASTTSASLLAAASTSSTLFSTMVPASSAMSTSFASTSTTPIPVNSVTSSSAPTAKASATESSSTAVSSSTVSSRATLALSSSTTSSTSTKSITASPVSTSTTTQSASASTSAQLVSTSTASRVYPVPTPVSGEVINSCKNPGDFALTFDDGPYTFGRSITDLLDKHNSLGTFFVNGNNFGCIYDFAEDLQARYLQGHQIASHTWTHPDITNITSAAFEKELDLIETAMMKILGIKPAFFRPPYGSYDDRTLAILKKRNYNVVYWSFDSEDWRTAPVADTLASYKKVIGKYPTPQISLNHETYQTTSDKIMPVVVPELIAAGYKLVTVSECLDIAPYVGVIGELGIRDKTWTCDGTPSG